jgi:hypothetical protein
LSTISGFFGKKIILDGYVPHWIELDEVISKSKFSLKLSIKSAFNAFRSLLAVYVFNLVVVANKRQVDLARGFLAPFSRTVEFNRIHLIPFGCEPYKERSRSMAIELLNKLTNKDRAFDERNFLVGWLGGTYGWFDLGPLVSDERKDEMLSWVAPEHHKNFFFLPYVDFENRFDYWAAFDVSLVWGGEGYENDYASRTRNFDCLSIGLPIIQNYDDEWGVRLVTSGSGVVTDIEHLADELMSLSLGPSRVKQMQSAMINLAPGFYWSKFANKLVLAVNESEMSFIRRFVGLLALLVVLPAIGLFFIYNLFGGLIKRKWF